MVLLGHVDITAHFHPDSVCDCTNILLQSDMVRNEVELVIDDPYELLRRRCLDIAQLCVKRAGPLQSGFLLLYLIRHFLED